MSRIPTASQTVGPFFNFGLTADPQLGILAHEGAAGERIRLELRLLDGEGAPLPGDGMVEIWQADSLGRYGEGDAHFRGFGRLETGPDGECAFETVMPGRAAGQAPHINVVIFARGLLRHLHTRVYFEGEPSNAEDPVLALVPQERRSTLVARRVADRPGAWRLEIRLQGDGETVFFDV